MAAKDGELRIFMVSGEISGDVKASRLMASLRSSVHSQSVSPASKGKLAFLCSDLNQCFTNFVHLDSTRNCEVGIN
uniref:Uncharacterized protein n=1 Tax=Nelumbo nucifera TaxID=4432 RepID=A0A822YJD7_NELNU|nr:TPA_asm: hypothetical protein HUJ06_011074 [Nelumbo nucifera]